MKRHIARWHSLTLSPADRAILDQMEEEMDEKTVLEFKPKQNSAEFTKIVDGKPVRVIDVDALSPDERKAYFDRHVSKDTPLGGDATYAKLKKAEFWTA